MDGDLDLLVAIVFTAALTDFTKGDLNFSNVVFLYVCYVLTQSFINRFENIFLCWKDQILKLVPFKFHNSLGFGDTPRKFSTFYRKCSD